MVCLLRLEMLTMKVKGVVPGGVLLVVPSGLTTSSMESTAVASSFWIVPVPTALAIVALVAPDRVTVKLSSGFFFFNDTATTEIYTLSLHDALPILVLLWLM